MIHAPFGVQRRVFDACCRLLAEGTLVAEPIVQPVVTPDDLIEAYRQIATHPERNVKLGAAF